MEDFEKANDEKRTTQKSAPSFSAVKACLAVGIFVVVVAVMCVVASLMMNSQENKAGKTGTDAANKQESSVQTGGITAADAEGTGAADTSAAGDKPGTAEASATADSRTGKEKTAAGSQAETAASGDKSGTAGTSATADSRTEQEKAAAGSQAGSTATGDSSSEGTSATDSTSGTAGGSKQTSDKRHIIAINAAHQEKADGSQEPIGPGASETKAKESGGASGTATGTPEYKLNLLLATALRTELEQRGYEVVMLREVNSVSISDAERANMANNSADMVIHIHANSDSRSDISGIMAFYPSEMNPYVSGLSASCRQLSECILAQLEAQTGAKNWGAISNDRLTAVNWSKIPVTHLEVGYLSNADEDRLLQTEAYQMKLVTGIADGIDDYWK